MLGKSFFLGFFLLFFLSLHLLSQVFIYLILLMVPVQVLSACVSPRTVVTKSRQTAIVSKGDEVSTAA